jgi:hypothetical protein
MRAEERAHAYEHEAYDTPQEVLAELRAAIVLLRELQEDLQVELLELAHRGVKVRPDALDLERRVNKFLDGEGGGNAVE